MFLMGPLSKRFCRFIFIRSKVTSLIETELKGLIGVVDGTFSTAILIAALLCTQGTTFVYKTLAQN